MRRRNVAFVLGLAFSLLLASPAAPQEQAGSIQGVIKDTSGGVLPGVTVEARSPSVVGVSTAVSDTEGLYRFPALPPGTYEITAALPGFTTAKVPGVVLALGQLLKVDLTLAVAGLAETIQVRGESPLIDVKQAAAFATIQNDVIEKIPKGRDFTSVVATAPGVNDESKTGGIGIDGASGSENRFVIDGMDTTSLRRGISDRTLLVDFVQEVQVKSSGYAAEYGGATGGVINAITKSGSNQFRGMAGTYFDNDGLQGDPRPTLRINPIDDITAETVYVPDDTWHRWSPVVDLGGPVFRDRLWFYAAYGSSIGQTSRTVTFRSNNQTQTFTRTGTPSSSYDSHYLNYNLTAQISNSMRLKFAGGNTRGRTRGALPAIQPDGTSLDSPTIDRINVGDNTYNDIYSGNLDWVLTPQFFVNIASGGLTSNVHTPESFYGDRLRHSFSTSNMTYLPGVIPDSLRQPSGYVDFKSSSGTVHDRYGRFYINANTTWFKSWRGQHMVKAGVRYERLTSEINLGNQHPTVSLSWDRYRATLDGRQVRGTYGYFTISRSYTDGNVASNNIGVWVQDSWTIKDRLTVNAGIRVENEHVPSYNPSDPGIDFGFGDKLAPRLGFAWDLFGDSRWKAYGSYGWFYDITKLDMPIALMGASHSISYYWTLDTYDWPNINCEPAATGCPGTYIEQVDFRHAANAVDPRLTAFFGEPRNTLEPNMKPVQTGEFTLGMDHELSGTMSVGVRYVHKWLFRTIEDVGVMVPDVGEVFFVSNPGFGVAEYILGRNFPPQPKAKRDYDGVELRVRKRLAKNWSLNASYLWSYLRGNYSGLASSDESGRTSPNNNRFFDSLYMSYGANGKAIYGRLQTDRPHAFKTQLTYDMPWGTSAGVDLLVENGSPMQAQISQKGTPVYYLGRNSLGRTPVYSNVNVMLQHDFRLFGSHRLNLNVNVDNLFDQMTVTSINGTRYRDGFNIADADYFKGYDADAVAAALGPAKMRPNPLYLRDNGWKARRMIRVGVKYIF